jgi:ketosteroid isomerase-like protein
MHRFLSFLVAVTAPLVPLSASGNSASDTAAVMATVKTLRAAVAAHDGAAVLAVIRPEGVATVVAERPDGTVVIRHPSWADFVGGLKPSPQKFDPRFNHVNVKVDGDIAMAWTPYVFFLDGKVHHCGVNHFDLLRENGSWKILNVTYTLRTAGCSE